VKVGMIAGSLLAGVSLAFTLMACGPARAEVLSEVRAPITICLSNNNFDFPVPCLPPGNTCADGELHTLIATTTDATGGVHVMISADIHATGVDSQGTTWTLRSSSATIDSGNALNTRGELLMEIDLDAISHGPEPNATLHSVVHFTFVEGKEFPVGQVAVLNVDCHG
jgi:hypothetical protein